MSASKMPDGRWKVTCRYKTWDGQVKQHKKEGFQTKREAQQYEKDFLAKKSGSASMKMSALLDIYLEDAQAHLKPTTYSSLKTTVDNIYRPTFGAYHVDEITPLLIRQWYNNLKTAPSKRTGKPFAASSLKLHYTRLSSIFNFACRYYGLKSNPCTHTVKHKAGAKHEIQFLTLAEFQKFRSVERAPIYKVAFDTLFWTGMRRGELLALTASDISGNRISITKNYTQVDGKEIIGTPKTESSTRTIDIPDFLLRELDPYITAAGSGRIFEAVTPSCLQRHCHINCDRAGVKQIRVHDLRHSHASLLIDRGASPLLIAERLGHENATITLQVYSHLYQSQRDNLTSILSECYENATQD